MKPQVPVDHLRRIFNYDPETGIFTWRFHRSSNLIDKVAGCSNHYGYWIIGIDNKRYMAHVIAWTMSHGYWPTFPLDHINLDKADNRIINLRASDKSNNGANRLPQKNNTSGYKGVFWHEVARKWMVQIRVRNKLIYGGLYDSAVAAAAAYDKLALEQFGAHAKLNLVAA